MNSHQSWLNDKARGGGLLIQFNSLRYFPKCSAFSKHMLDIEYHVYIWQISSQLSYDDTCQIWMWYKLDMSTARRRLKSPRSLFGTTAHPTMVTPVNIMVNGWLPSFSFNVNRLSHSWDKAISDLETQRSRSRVGRRARSSILLIRFHFISHQSDQQFLRYSYFEILPWNIQGQGHISYPASNRCISFSFHINRTNHSWDMTKIVFDLEKSHPIFL